MTRRSQGCSVGFEPAELAVEVARVLRSRGYPVSTAEAVEAARLLGLYEAVHGGLDCSDLELVLVSVYARRRGDEAAVREALAAVLGFSSLSVAEGIEHDLRRLRAWYGRSLRKPLSRMDSSERAAFARLRLLGVVRRGRRGYHVVGESAARRRVVDLSRRYGGYREAVAGELRRLLSRGRGGDVVGLLGEELLSYVDLGSLGIRELVELGSRGRGVVRRAAVRELARRLTAGGDVGGRAEEAFELLEREGLLDERLLGVLLEAEPRLAERAVHAVGFEAVADAASRVSKVDPERGAEIYARLVGGARARGAVRELMRHGLPVSGGDSSALREAGALASAREALMKFLAGGGEGYLDFAEYEVGRAGGGSGLAVVRARLLEAIRRAREGDTAAALRMLVSDMDDYEAYSFLGEVAARGVDESTRLAARRLMRLILERAVRRVAAGFRWSRRRLLGEEPGERLELRETVYRVVRMAAPLPVWERRGRLPGVVLALDKSASMRPYAFYASVVAAALAPVIRRLVVFDAVPEVVDERALRGMSVESLVERVLGVEFSGYTDVSGALRAAVRGLPPGHLVVVSDLRQTVVGEDPVAVLAELAGRRWRVDLVVPRRPEGVEHVQGLRVHVVRGASSLSRVLARIVARV